MEFPGDKTGPGPEGLSANKSPELISPELVEVLTFIDLKGWGVTFKEPCLSRFVRHGIAREDVAILFTGPPTCITGYTVKCRPAIKEQVQIALREILSELKYPSFDKSSSAKGLFGDWFQRGSREDN
ncbi:MAG: hypothetical protein UT55_C0044G0006 [Candidatus Peregrinibacteria bacterium GW2011_GWE2_39_6]|nr:MAG: hypothetical protein UT36_C0001G0187 [Candidatus Peregrinibacteria bacterium GW2011_GWF2_39_17]KKR25449.1 MAG: hypothetical protein UT55_C0044G0006 [Candidatus Peregrinibacteria bacterium GW2011_GWE2_39_6]HCW32625.1 hypothetical protein [Candidatus Peregrinibacteria bacterium]